MAKTPAPEPRTDTAPIHTIRHRRIKASIWRNRTSKGVMYDVKIVRLYLDGETWRDSHGFGYDDLLVVAKLMYDAHSFISALRAKDAGGERMRRRSQSNQG